MTSKMKFLPIVHYCSTSFMTQTTRLTVDILPSNKSLSVKKGLQHVEANQSLYWAITKNQRDTHSVWKSQKSLIQHCERSELRLHFEWTKVN